jgi:RecA-family ATPase
MKEIEELNRLSDPDILQTVTLSELYETVYESKPPVIEDILFPGLCIVAGDSKIGKSFLVSQFAYHVAAGTDMWDKRSRRERCCTLRLRTNTRGCRKECTKCFQANQPKTCTFP